ncbi:MAG: phosphoribosyltransferase family protein [Rhodoglobus sp.]
MVVYQDRVDAGRQLAGRLERFRGMDAVVLGLPRGGVPVASEVAQGLNLPLDVIIVRKLGVPFQPEVAMGAIGEGDVRVLDHRLISSLNVSETELRDIEEHERATLLSRTQRFRRGRERLDLRGRTAIIVDDGVATGATARAACEVARVLGAARIVLAVPVGPPDTLERFAEADEVICLAMPEQFWAVGAHYRDFSPTSEEDVIVLLDAAARRMERVRPVAAGCDEEVGIPLDDVLVEGHLHLPEPTGAIVLFAHGSGSSRHSPRNRMVADVLYEAGIGTLLLDLLTSEEELDRANVFDIRLLADRLVGVAEWLRTRPGAAGARLGYFGASTGAGAALAAAALRPDLVSAVVSRGGRPELAGDLLAEVTAPTLLIVGSEDPLVLDLNRRALTALRGEKRLSIVEGASHLFEEPGTLAEVALLARDWFAAHLLP